MWANFSMLHHMKKRLFPLCTGLLSVFLVSCAGYQTPPAAHSGPVPVGYYRVQQGDNLYRIGLRFNQSTATLARWNRLADVNQLEVGQLLRVRPEGGQGRVASRPSQPSATKKTPPRTTGATPPVSSATLRDLDLSWPASGSVLATYNGSSNKGINIGGGYGSPVLAAASGDVVYASDQVRGYGKMVLIRHNKQVLTAYAHNSQLLVKVGQKVRKGEQIAKMGTADNGQTLLHFELRLNGRAVNPMPHLPAR